MNETKHSPDLANVPWPTSDQRAATPDTSTAPGSTPAAVELLNHAAQGAHETIDRIAQSAAPAARQLGERVSAAGAALHLSTDQLRDTRDEWVEGVRASVRNNPLATIAAAVALGALIARIAR